MGQAEGLSRIPGASYFTSFCDAVFPQNPVTGSRQLKILPESWEKSLGEKMYAAQVEYEGGVVVPETDEELARVARVEEVFNKLIAQVKRSGLSYEVKVINSDSINAWCLPGGKIGICRGALEKISEVAQDIKDGGEYRYMPLNAPNDAFSYGKLTEEDLIAAILAHEITHADARHAARKTEWSAIFQGAVFGADVISKYMLSARKERLEREIQDLSGSRVILSRQAVNPNAEKQESLRVETLKQKESQKNWTEILQRIQEVVFYALKKFGKMLYDLAGSRSHEHEADIYGSYLAEDAGYKGYAGLLCMMDILRNGAPDRSDAGWREKAYRWLSTHPFFEDRQAKIFTRPEREHLRSI